MATLAKKTTVVKPKTPKVVKPVVEAPVPEPVTVEAPALVESDTEPHKTRIQTNKAIDVSISAARVRRHFDKLRLNVNVDAKIAELKELNAPHTAALKALEALVAAGASASEIAVVQVEVDKLTPEAAINAEKLAAYSRERTRLTTNTPVCLSVIADEMCAEIAAHAMDNVIKSGMKIIKVSHIHSDGVDKLSLYPLFATLPSFKSVADATTLQATQLADKLEKSLLLAQAEKDFRKKYNVKAIKEPKLPKVKPVEQAVVEEDCPDNKTSFKFYVQQLCKKVSQLDPRFKSIRVSTEFRDYVSELIAEFIERMAPLVQCTANSMKNKTVSDIAVMRTVENLLIDGHKPVETIELKEETFTDPAALKEEVAKREAAKLSNTPYKTDVDSLPKVNGFVAVRTITYPTSGYAKLLKVVDEKLALYKEHSTETTA